MEQSANSEYLNLFSELIKKQIVVLGPDITLAKVRGVGGITVDEQGNVTKIQGDAKLLLSQLINQFVELSGLIVKKTMESILLNYSGGLSSMGATLTNAITGGASISTPAQNTVSLESQEKNPIQPTNSSIDLSNPLGGLDEAKIAELNKMLEDLDKQSKTLGDVKL